MGNASCKIKNGMSGSKNGHSRWDNTEILKDNSKKTRRTLDKQETIGQLEDFACEFCGIYTALRPKCNKCERD